LPPKGLREHWGEGVDGVFDVLATGDLDMAVVVPTNKLAGQTEGGIRVELL
jgi:hypothetical protein